MTVEQRLDAVEKRLADLAGRLEEVAGRTAEPTPPDLNRTYRRPYRANVFWGLVLIVVGLVWMGNQMEWFDLHIPFLPVVAIILGLHLLMKS